MLDSFNPSWQINLGIWNLRKGHNLCFIQRKLHLSPKGPEFKFAYQLTLYGRFLKQSLDILPDIEKID